MRKILITLLVISLIFAGCGSDGKDGIDGKDGADGTNGVDGEDGKDGTNGTDGKDGEDGTNGTDGKDGTNGTDGEDGTNGTDGEDGANGTDGINGTNGEDGADGEDGKDGKIPFGFDLIKPENNKTFATTSYVTYSLAKDVQEVRFIRTRASGTGPETDTVVLTGDDALAGYHESVEITGADLTEGDIYHLQVQALDLDGDTVDLTPVFNLTVDNTGPELLKAEAYQSVFGRWSTGDRLVFTFNEPMDTSNLSTLSDMLANITDGNASGDDFAGDLLVWSSDLKTLSITFSGSIGGTVFTAGAYDCSDCSEFTPSANVRDYAGNSDETAAGIKLISKGDVSNPRLNITSPSDGSSVPVEPVITYELSEKLVEAKFTVTYLEKGTAEEIVTREVELSGAPLYPGNRSIPFSSEGIPPLVDGAYYSIAIEGVDGAGNKTSDKIYGIVADDTAPTPPYPAKIFVRNYSGEVVVEAGETVGESGDYLRLYVDGVLTATAEFPGPYGKTEEHVVIAGLATITEGAAITYSLIDKAGNESELVSDGSMLPAPTFGDIANLGLRVGTTDYQLSASGNLSSNLDLFTILDQNPDKVFYTGWTDGGGAFSASPNSIPASEISYGAEIYYTYHETSSGHYSRYSDRDGTIEKLISVAVRDMDYNEDVSSNDNFEVTMSGGVTVPNDVTGNFSYGSCSDQKGNHRWAYTLSDFNFAPVSTQYFATFTSPGFFIYASGTDGSDHGLGITTRNLPAGSIEFDIGLFFSSFTAGRIYELRFDFAPLGTNLILSSDGGHCVLPATKIEAEGQTGGLVSDLLPRPLP